MTSRVRVLDTTHVRPELPPGHATTFKLSPFDTLFLALPPIQRIFFYDDGGGASLPPFPAIIHSLQASLAAILSVFSPLAGRLAACPDGDLVVDCSPDALCHGIRFVQAEYSGDAADMRRLARDAEHDIEAFVQLVPQLAVGRLPAPLLAVQVTRPAPVGGRRRPGCPRRRGGRGLDAPRGGRRAVAVSVHARVGRRVAGGLAGSGGARDSPDV
ncbi:Anthocyanin 5-aromatic acyltransferase [Hordeum vulgare]|nr:Anthocyanin 5-aromatic acyltransferase [Hordeum vulgare]